MDTLKSGLTPFIDVNRDSLDFVRTSDFSKAENAGIPLEQTGKLNKSQVADDVHLAELLYDSTATASHDDATFTSRVRDRLEQGKLLSSLRAMAVYLASRNGGAKVWNSKLTIVQRVLKGAGFKLVNMHFGTFSKGKGSAEIQRLTDEQRGAKRNGHKQAKKAEAAQITSAGSIDKGTDVNDARAARAAMLALTKNERVKLLRSLAKADGYTLAKVSKPKPIPQVKTGRMVSHVYAQ